MTRLFKVLLVDDEPALLSLLGRALILKGYDVAFASDGKSACEVLNSRGFDLVVTDLHMGTVDGFAVLKRAKKLNSNTSVYVMTGDRDPSVVLESLRLGADNLLFKPFDLNKLIQRVTSLHSQSKRVAQGVDLN
jgi:DNA-binding response OmpR family regulator